MEMQINPLLSEMDCKAKWKDVTSEMEHLHLRQQARSAGKVGQPQWWRLPTIGSLIRVIGSLVPPMGYAQGLGPYPLDPEAA
jgi:hypothetical protein